jgi:ABC-type uncharacterized transport system substrate-binding protein
MSRAIAFNPASTALGGRHEISPPKTISPIPIVIAGVTDPVAQRIVARLDRPGGNITGFADLGEASLGGKWLELLSEIAPGLKRAANSHRPISWGGA